MDDIKKQKLFIAIVVILSIYMLLGIITNYIDSARITTGHEPKFCIKRISHDGGKVTYFGLTYKVVRYVGVSPNEPFKSNIGVKMGSWFMVYKLDKRNPIVVEYDDKSYEISNINEVNYISNILLHSRYEESICLSKVTHKLIFDGEEYYLKPDCSSIQRDDRQAELSRDDLNNILDIIER